MIDDFFNVDTHFMRIAIEEAKKALAENEVPIGSVVVENGRIIGRGHNHTEQFNDVTAHAEIVALTAAAETVGGKYLPDATIYVTVEPCLMCAGAIGWSQIKRIVYGASDPKRGYTSFVDKSPFHPRSTVVAGVMADQAAWLMQQFFNSKR